MMTMEVPKVKFLNARIVGSGVNPAAHHKQEFKRGDSRFVMSRGELMKFNECPVKWIAGVDDDPSTFRDWGELIDCLVLTPEQFSNRFAVCPETYPDSKTGEAKPWNFNAKFCETWREDHEGKTIIKHDMRLSAELAIARFDFEEFVEATAPAQFQVSMSADYSDPATGLTIPLRALVDIAPVGGEYHNSLIDLKTTSSAEPRAWARRVVSDHLDAQAAFYLDLWQAATGEERTDFRHIIQESSAPYHIELRLLSQEFIELGRLKYRHALLKYCQCLSTKVWPGYETREMTFGRWALCSPEAWMLDAA